MELQNGQAGKETGRKCAQNDLAWLIAVQGNARFFVEGALAAGFPPQQARFFPDAPGAGEFCRSLLEPGDLVLVKGSRGVHLEKVVEMLKESRSRGVEDSRDRVVKDLRSREVEESRSREGERPRR